MPKQIYKEWTKQEEWEGNPSLGYDSWAKHFRNPHNRRLTPIYLFGETASKKLHYCVAAGPNSDYSYGNCFYPDEYDFTESMEQIDILYKQGKLFK